MASSRSYDKRSLTSLIKRVSSLNGTTVEAGFFEEDRYGPENDNMQVAEVAWLQERGAGREIPSRPFMETSFNRMHADFYARGMYDVMFDVLGQGRLTNRLLKDLGGLMRDNIKIVIDGWSIPPNSARWAEFKGFNDPLIFSGKMIQSVKFKVEKVK